jgi:hypothetical protein
MAVARLNSCNLHEFGAKKRIPATLEPSAGKLPSCDAPGSPVRNARCWDALQWAIAAPARHSARVGVRTCAESVQVSKPTHPRARGQDVPRDYV